MPDKAWKAEERKVARMFGTERKLMKGTDEVEDVISDKFVIDVKLRKTLLIKSWFLKVREDAEKKGKIPILICRRPQISQLRLAAIDDNMGSRLCEINKELFQQVSMPKRTDIETFIRNYKKVHKKSHRIPVFFLQDEPITIMECHILVSALKGLGML